MFATLSWSRWKLLLLQQHNFISCHIISTGYGKNDEQSKLNPSKWDLLNSHHFGDLFHHLLLKHHDEKKGQKATGRLRDLKKAIFQAQRL